MGQAELEAALRRAGDEKARQIWAKAEAELEKLRSEQLVSLKHEQQDAARALDKQISDFGVARRNAAEFRALESRLRAETVLAERLYHLAQQQLEDLAGNGGDALFESLADEIPDHHWTQVQVNSRDLHLARTRFPQAEIEACDDIVAGLIVRAQQGRLQIENTLGKRLQHIWPDLLPQLLKELKVELGDDEAAD